MKKSELRSAVDRMLRRWSVPSHKAFVENRRGRLVVHILDGNQDIETDIDTTAGPETMRHGLLALEASIRRCGCRQQADIEDYCT